MFDLPTFPLDAPISRDIFELDYIAIVARNEIPYSFGC